MLRKADVGTGLRWAAAAATAGGAWLGLGVILADENPAAVLGVIAALFGLAGGWAARTGARPAVLRTLACLLPVLLARWVGGSLVAALAAGCVAAGWWLRVRFSDAVLVFALFGGAVAAVSSPSGHLVLAFVVLGVLTVAIGPALASARGYLRRIVVLRNESEGPRAPAPDKTAGEREAPTPVAVSPTGDGRPLCSNQVLEVNR